MGKLSCLTWVVNLAEPGFLIGLLLSFVLGSLAVTVLISLIGFRGMDFFVCFCCLFCSKLQLALVCFLFFDVVVFHQGAITTSASI